MLLIDTANLAEIEKALKALPLVGVTTCPTIIVKEKRNVFDILKDIRKLIGDNMMLHAQVMADTPNGILRDAVALRSQISGDFYVKVPVTLAGFQAMPLLCKEGIAFTATTIHSAAQAILAAEHGASFLAPYINRIDNLDASGAELVRQVADYLKMHNLPAKILAASFRNVRQITDVLLAGAHTVTLSPDLAWKMTEHPMTDLSVKTFRDAWTDFYGADKDVYNLM